MAKRRFAKFPDLAARLREMSPEGREIVRVWHQLTKAGFENFSLYAPKEAMEGETDARIARALAQGAQMACRAWLATLSDLSEVITDPREAEWCCHRGMLAYPDPCPQHVAMLTPETLPLGTILRSPDELEEWGPGRVSVVKVADRISVRGYYWRGVHHSLVFDDEHVRGWYYEGEVKP